MRRRLSRPSLLVSAAAGLALTVSGLAPVSAQPAPPPGGDAGDLTQTAVADPGTMTAEQWAEASSDSGMWIVRAQGPSVAAYSALVDESGLTQSDVEGYRADLVQQHTELQAEVEQTLGRSVDVAHTYVNAFNGFAAEMSKTEAERLRSLQGVAEVYPDEVRELDTDVSHEVIRSAAVWEDDNGLGDATRGEGVVVGMIDSGVNPEHPSFAEVADDGFEHENPYGEGNYVGVCDPDSADHEPDFPCNDKLIGAYNLHPSSPSARDADDHGSHVGSTIAGTYHEATVTIGGTEFQRTLQGVAPRANVISYLVCYPGCPGASTIAAVDAAIGGDVDVLNYSISGGDSPWTDPVDLAFLDAYAAGITVVASAGNSGPGARTVAKTGPWNSSVAATTHHRAFGHSVRVEDESAPDELQDFPGFPGGGPAVTGDLTRPVIDAADLGNQQGCSAFPAGSLEDSIALIERGGCTFPEKVGFAADAGADAVLLGNNSGGPPIAPGGLEDTTIPAVQTDRESYRALRSFLDEADEDVDVTIEAGVGLYLNEDWTDIVAGFSSRGPSQFDMLAPTFAAPGVNILAAASARDGDAERYAVLQGTSMSSPHGAGAAALMVALQPEWSPSEIRSALASSAVDEGILKDDASTPADPFDIGSGRIDLGRAANVGLVMEETEANFRAGNPSAGGSPRELNLPAFVDWTCEGTCSWTRTLTSTVDGSATYTASVLEPEGMQITVEPSSFTLDAEGATQEITVTVDAGSADLDQWAFGRVTLATTDSHASGAAITDTEYPVVVTPQPGTASVEVDPEEITSTQPVDTTREHELTIGNPGGDDLHWEFVDSYEGPLVDQPVGGTSGIVSTRMSDLEGGAYTAEDFSVGADGTQLTSLEVPGFVSLGLDLSDWADNLVWEIYADADGAPDGYPYGPTEPVWSFEAEVGAAGVDLTDSHMNLDIAASAADPVVLDEGTYWLAVHPEIDTIGGLVRWNWFQGANGTGNDAMLSDPQGIFGGTAAWEPLPDLGLDWDAQAMTIGASVECGADWLGVDPASGSTAPDATSTVTVTTDSTGLEVDSTHTANLCLSTNDGDNPVVLVPVTMTVTEAEPDPIVVERLAGTDRYGTAVAISADTHGPDADVVFVATGRDYPDALTGAALAGSLDAPVLLTHPTGLTRVTATELERLDPDRVVVLGGPNVVADTVLGQIADLTGADVDRIAGENRYATAAQVAAELPDSDRVYVATGRDYPDALAAAARAGALDAPVLLVQPRNIPRETAAALTALDPDTITVLGGEGAVTDEVVQELGEWGTTTRTAGKDRYLTAARLMQDYESAQTVYLASGQDWPDALAGSALAGSGEAPLVLSRKDGLPIVTGEALLRLNPERVVIFGGEGAITEEVADQIRDLR